MRRLICIALATSFLSACGIKGELDTPPPIWGKKDNAKPVQPTPTETPTPDTDIDTDG